MYSVSAPDVVERIIDVRYHYIECQTRSFKFGGNCTTALCQYPYARVTALFDVFLSFCLPCSTPVSTCGGVVTLTGQVTAVVPALSLHVHLALVQAPG